MDSHKEFRSDLFKIAAEVAVAAVPQEVKEVVNSLQLPEGFTKTVSMPYSVERGWYDTGEGAESRPGAKVIIKNADGSVNIELFVEMWDEKDPYKGPYLEKKGGVVWWGDVNFVAGGKNYSFTRRGIDSNSFSGGTNAQPDEEENSSDLSAQIQFQINRAAQAIERKKGAVNLPAPFDNFAISPADLDRYKQQLKAGKTVQLTPGGMGIGYELTTKMRGRGQSGFMKPCPAAVAKIFEVPQLYYSTFDHD